ncbi:MAG: hypothetical protein RLZZ535_2716, partial [Cyanobacteriota bacterium]
SGEINKIILPNFLDTFVNYEEYEEFLLFLLLLNR